MRHQSKVSDREVRYRIYRYGLLPPRDSLAAILEEDRKLTDLWNAVVACGEDSRAKWEEAFRADPELQLRQANLDALRRQSREGCDLWKASRRAKAPAAERAAAWAAYGAARTALGEGLREFRLLRKRVGERLRSRRDELIKEKETRVAGLLREAKAAGIAWASAQAVVDRWRTGWSQALRGKCGFPRPKAEGAAPPHVFRYTQGGSRLARLFNPRSKTVRLVLPPAGQPPEGLSRSGLRRWEKKQGRGRAILRIGSTTHDFGLVLHRMPQANGLVKKVEVVRSETLVDGKHVARWDWHLQVTMAEPAPFRAQHSRPGTVAALALGWRRLGERLRAGVMLSGDGEVREVWLPEKVLRRNERARRIQARMDRETEETKAALLPLLAEPALVDAEIRKTVGAWERVRAGGLRRLLGRLETLGPSVPLDHLHSWERRRRRLQAIRRRILVHLRRHRSWWWQNEIHGLLESYSTILHPELVLNRLLRKQDASPVPIQVQRAATANQQLAGLHEARRWLSEMAAKTATAVVELPAENLGKRCSSCGRCQGCAESLEASRISLHTCHLPEGPAERIPGPRFECSGCAWEGDRGLNVARNLLATWCSPKPAVPEGDTARDATGEVRSS